MYICICKAVTESQICEAIQQGLCTRKEITACLRAGTGCGKCNPEIRDLLRRGRGDSRAIQEQASRAATYRMRVASSGQEACL